MVDRKRVWTPAEIAMFDNAWHYMEETEPAIRERVEKFKPEVPHVDVKYEIKKGMWGSLVSFKDGDWTRREAQSVLNFAADIGNTFDLRVINLTKNVLRDPIERFLIISLKPYFDKFR